MLPTVFYVDSSVIGSWIKQRDCSDTPRSRDPAKPCYPKLLGAFKKGSKIYGSEGLVAGLTRRRSTTGCSQRPQSLGAAEIRREDAPAARSRPPESASRPTGPGWAPCRSRVEGKRQGGHYVGLIKSGLAFTRRPRAAGAARSSGPEPRRGDHLRGQLALVRIFRRRYANAHFSVAPMVHNKKQGPAFTAVRGRLPATRTRRPPGRSSLARRQAGRLWMSKGRRLLAAQGRGALRPSRPLPTPGGCRQPELRQRLRPSWATT